VVEQAKSFRVFYFLYIIIHVTPAVCGSTAPRQKHSVTVTQIIVE